MQVGDLVMWQGAPRTAKPMLVAGVKAPGGIPWLVKLCQAVVKTVKLFLEHHSL